MNIKDMISWLGGESNLEVEEYLAEDQFLNETPKGLRITHIPTQIKVSESNFKRYENKKKILNELIKQVQDYYTSF